MATISSHLLNSVDGTHASGVKVIINQINSSGIKKIFFETENPNVYFTMGTNSVVVFATSKYLILYLLILIQDQNMLAIPISLLQH